jgi:hypothetical protein
MAKQQRKKIGNWEFRLRRAITELGMPLVRQLMEWEVLRVRHEGSCNFMLNGSAGEVCDCDAHGGEGDDKDRDIAFEQYWFTHDGVSRMIRVRHTIG